MKRYLWLFLVSFVLVPVDDVRWQITHPIRQDQQDFFRINMFIMKIPSVFLCNFRGLI